MTEKAQEDMYFYRINTELIRHLRDVGMKSPAGISPISELIASKPIVQKADSLYDFLEEHLSPDPHWHVDICY
jgi:hypothetical protein